MAAGLVLQLTTLGGKYEILYVIFNDFRRSVPSLGGVFTRYRYRRILQRAGTRASLVDRINYLLLGHAVLDA